MKLNNLYHLRIIMQTFINRESRSKQIDKVIMQLLLLFCFSTIYPKEITVIFNGKPLKLNTYNSNQLHGEIDGKKVIATINKKINSPKAQYLGTFKKLKRSNNEKKLVTYHVFEAN